MTPEDLNHWLLNERDPERPSRPVRAFICPDGFAVSIQANSFAYCEPREDGALWYASVELGYPNRTVAAWLPYADDPDNPQHTVYGYVPVEMVADVLTRHGA